MPPPAIACARPFACVPDTASSRGGWRAKRRPGGFSVVADDLERTKPLRAAASEESGETLPAGASAGLSIVHSFGVNRPKEQRSGDSSLDAVLRAIARAPARRAP